MAATFFPPNRYRKGAAGEQAGIHKRVGGRELHSAFFTIAPVPPAESSRSQDGLPGPFNQLFHGAADIFQADFKNGYLVAVIVSQLIFDDGLHRNIHYVNANSFRT